MWAYARLLTAMCAFMDSCGSWSTHDRLLTAYEPTQLFLIAKFCYTNVALKRFNLFMGAFMIFKMGFCKELLRAVLAFICVVCTAISVVSSRDELSHTSRVTINMSVQAASVSEGFFILPRTFAPLADPTITSPISERGPLQCMFCLDVGL